MTNPFSKILLAVLVLVFGVQAAAQDAADPHVVPVAQEPRHRLVLEDQYMRLFDVRNLPGGVTLYHTHQLDSIYIPISGLGNLLNQEYGKAAKPLAIKPGSITFAEHAKAPLTHRILNLGAEPFHVMDIELIASPRDAALRRELPAGHQLVLENHRVRISRVAIEPEQSMVGLAPPALHGVAIVLTGTRMGIREVSGGTRIYGVVPGQFFTSAELASREIQNAGNDRLELVSIELK